MTGPRTPRSLCAVGGPGGSRDACSRPVGRPRDHADGA